MEIEFVIVSGEVGDFIHPVRLLWGCPVFLGRFLYLFWGGGLELLREWFGKKDEMGGVGDTGCHLLQLLIPHLYRLVEIDKQCGMNHAERKLHLYIQNGITHTVRSVGVGDVVARVMRVYCHKRGHRVVRGLHELRGFAARLLGVEHVLQQRHRLHHAAVAGVADNGIGGAVMLGQYMQRSRQGLANLRRQTTGLGGRDIALGIDILPTEKEFALVLVQFADGEFNAVAAEQQG